MYLHFAHLRKMPFYLNVVQKVGESLLSIRSEGRFPFPFPLKMPITGTNERAAEKREGGEKVHHCTLHSGDGGGGKAASLSIRFFPALCSYTHCSRLFPTTFAEKTFLLPFSPIPAWSLGDDDDDSFFSRLWPRFTCAFLLLTAPVFLLFAADQPCFR